MQRITSSTFVNSAHAIALKKTAQGVGRRSRKSVFLQQSLNW